jgi:hypothetical protein
MNVVRYKKPTRVGTRPSESVTEKLGLLSCTSPKGRTVGNCVNKVHGESGNLKKRDSRVLYGDVFQAGGVK